MAVGWDSSGIVKMRAKKKILGGREYLVLGSTIERQGFDVVFKSYTTPKGKVTIKDGVVAHPDGTTTAEWGMVHKQGQKI